MNNRPTSVTVFGILNLVFGVLGICGLAFSLVMFLVPQDPAMPNPVLVLMQDNMAFMVFTYISTTLGFIASIVLIAAGVGLLKVKPWGRHLSIGYGIYAIISVVIGSIVNYFVIMRPILNEVVGRDQAGPVVIGGVIGGVLGGCFSLIYPVLLLIYMFTPRVKAAFSGQLLPEPDAGFSPPTSFDNTDPNNPYDSPRSS